MPPATTRTSPRLKGGPYKVTKASPEKAGSGKKPLTTPQERAARRNAITNESLSELRNQCIASGINPDGTRPELMKRLLANQNFGEIGDAILVTEARLPGQNSSISDVKEALRGALESTTFNVREIKGRNFLGDDESLEYAAAKMDLPEVRETVGELEEQVSDLRNELEQYKDLAIGIRHRFINTYKRRFRRMTIYEVRQIERTSHKIHSGDAVGDAELFVSRQRNDVWVYEKLYWFTPHEVMGFAGEFKSCPVNEFAMSF